jgi:hypothetical protein
MYFIFVYSDLEQEYVIVDEDDNELIKHIQNDSDLSKLHTYLINHGISSLLIYRDEIEKWFRIDNPETDFVDHINDNFEKLISEGYYLLQKKKEIPPGLPVEIITDENFDNLTESTPVDLLQDNQSLFFNPVESQMDEKHEEFSFSDYKTENMFSESDELEKLERIKRISKISKGFLGLHQFSEYIGFENSEELIKFFSKYVLRGLDIDWGENLIRFDLEILIREIDQIIAYQLEIDENSS